MLKRKNGCSFRPHKNGDDVLKGKFRCELVAMSNDFSSRSAGLWSCSIGAHYGVRKRRQLKAAMPFALTDPEEWHFGVPGKLVNSW
jgi:hypothetical protein